jgi:hypothetical protein
MTRSPVALRAVLCAAPRAALRVTLRAARRARPGAAIPHPACFSAGLGNLASIHIASEVHG